MDRDRADFKRTPALPEAFRTTDRSNPGHVPETVGFDKPQKNNATCQPTASLGRKASAEYAYDGNNILTRHSNVHGLIYNFVLMAHYTPFLYLLYYSVSYRPDITTVK